MTQWTNTGRRVVSILAWRTSRPSVAEAKRLADIEADRRHDERRPDSEPTIEPVGDGTWHRLVLRLATGEPVDRLVIEIVGSTSLRFSSQSARGQHSRNVDRPERLQPHTAEAAWRVQFDDDDRGRNAALAVTAWVGDEQWTTTIPVDLPPPLPVAFWS